MDNTVTAVKKESEIILTINNEKQLNALNLDIIANLKGKLEEAQRDNSIKSIILTGSGSTAFCTGANLKEFKDISQEDIVDWCVDGSADLFNYIASMKKTVIAAVNGYAMGGGLELALCCDIRIASSNSIFSSPEYNLGWIPGWGGIIRLASIVGESKAKEILLLRKKIDSEEAKKLGIINEVVSQVELLDKALEIGKNIAKLNPMTVALTKSILNKVYIDQKQCYLEGLAVGMLSKSEYAKTKIEKFEERTKKK